MSCFRNQKQSLTPRSPCTLPNGKASTRCLPSTAEISPSTAPPMAVPWPSSLSRDRTCIRDLLRHDRSDDPIPEQDSGLARLCESKTNIVIKGEHVDFDSPRVPKDLALPANPLRS